MVAYPFRLFRVGFYTTLGRPVPFSVKGSVKRSYLTHFLGFK